MSREQQIDIIIDLLTEFDEMGFCPTTPCPDPDGYAREWKRKLVDALQGYRKQSENTVEFPCKVGDKAWLVYTPRYPANPSDKGKWFMAEDGVQRLIYGAKGVSIETWNMGTISAKEIGKKLFFTKEEAESVLAKMKGGAE